MSEQQTSQAEQPIINPYEKLVLDLLDNVKDDWGVEGIRAFINIRIEEIEDA